MTLPAPTTKWKTYSAYKPSGVDWFGQIPSHWQMARVSECAHLINGYPFESECFNRTEGIPLVRIRDLTSDGTEVYYSGPPVTEALIRNGDILIGMDGDFNVARWRGGEALLNQRMCCLRVGSRTDAGFLAYLLPFPLKVINDLTYSTTVKHLSSLDVKRVRMAFPPRPEQRAIATFLDRETAKIDALVAKRERLIELLQEKRAALITHAVTKGLNPSAPMRPSGVEWLGQIPAHWQMRRLKHVISAPLQYGANAAAELVDPELPRYVRITDVREDGTLRDETFRSIPEAVAGPYI